MEVKPISNLKNIVDTIDPKVKTKVRELVSPLWKFHSKNPLSLGAYKRKSRKKIEHNLLTIHKFPKDFFDERKLVLAGKWASSYNGDVTLKKDLDDLLQRAAPTTTGGSSKHYNLVLALIYKYRAVHYFCIYSVCTCTSLERFLSPFADMSEWGRGFGVEITKYEDNPYLFHPIYGDYAECMAICKRRLNSSTNNLEKEISKALEKLLPNSKK